MADLCPGCGAGLSVYGPAYERIYLCNLCGWTYPGSFRPSLAVPPPQFSSPSDRQPKPTTSADPNTTGASSEIEARVALRLQTPVKKIFSGSGPDVELKRKVALRYINSNPSQYEIMAWLQKSRQALPCNWNLYQFRDWADAWDRRPDLVKSFFSRITGKLRANGYHVGRLYKL